MNISGYNKDNSMFDNIVLDFNGTETFANSLEDTACSTTNIL